jgi:hypothetical protein
VSVYKTITTAVLQRFVAANREGCAATRNFSGRETHPQSCSCRHRNDSASGHTITIVELQADAGPGILSQSGAGMGKNTNGITVMGYPKIRLVA